MPEVCCPSACWETPAMLITLFWYLCICVYFCSGLCWSLHPYMYACPVFSPLGSSFSGHFWVRILTSWSSGVCDQVAYWQLGNPGFQNLMKDTICLPSNLGCSSLDKRVDPHFATSNICSVKNIHPSWRYATHIQPGKPDIRGLF